MGFFSVIIENFNISLQNKFLYEATVISKVFSALDFSRGAEKLSAANK